MSPYFDHLYFDGTYFDVDTVSSGRSAAKGVMRRPVVPPDAPILDDGDELFALF